MPCKYSTKEYAVITFKASLAIQTKKVKAVIRIESNKEVEEMLRNAKNGELSVTLERDFLTEGCL